MKVRDAAGDQFAPCSIPNCTRTAGEPPHTHEGKPVCPLHARELVGGVCRCGLALDDGPYRIYPAHDGRAVCIDCWAQYG